MIDGSDLLTAYDRREHWCETLGGVSAPAARAAMVSNRLGRLTLSDLVRRAEIAERELYNLGITVTVYSERDVIDRTLPFDVRAGNPAMEQLDETRAALAVHTQDTVIEFGLHEFSDCLQRQPMAITIAVRQELCGVPATTNAA